MVDTIAFKLNDKPVEALTYTDKTADNGERYCYVARAVDAIGVESVDSGEVCVKVP